MVLLRSDGTPTYMLAVVVDDQDMGVTHVIRGADHLNNAARQLQIIEAMGWPVPVYGHLPLINGPDGAKLSKRHGAQSVSEYRAMGYLPEAVRNYLARLGWGHGDDEIFSDVDAASWFDLRDVTKASARLDLDKLNHFNQHYIRLADDERLLGLVRHVLNERDLILPPDTSARLIRTIPLVKEGAKTIPELADLCLFALRPASNELPDKTRGQFTDELKARFGRLVAWLTEAGDWSAEGLAAGLKTFSDAEGGFGKFAPQLRVILAAGVIAPDLASALAALGRDESLARIADALSQVQ
jgi:glutamyl-tRNA synthetase